MRLTLTKGFFFGILALALVSCGGDEGDMPNVPVTFLATGASFDYYYSDGFYEDSIKSVVEEQIGVDTFLVRNYSESIDVIPTQYWVLDGNNFYSSFRLRDPDMYVIECKFNKPVGTTWTVTKQGSTFTYKIEALNVSFMTGEGLVEDAVKIKITAPGANPGYSYVSPSVGPLGNGEFDTDAAFRLVKYSTGTAAVTTNVIPAITYGDFPFLKVGNFWEYYESSIFGEEDVLTVTVESKLPSTNIYKVLVAYESGGSSYGYWYEDNGFLMAYDNGETVLEADPIYVHESVAELGMGWGSQTPSGTFFIYEVQELDQMVDSYFGNVSAMGIYVTSGFFSSQTNYWNLNKGNVLVTGLLTRDVTDSNARTQAKPRPVIPIISF